MRLFSREVIAAVNLVVHEQALGGAGFARDLLRQLHGLKISTACSGVGSPEVALSILASASRRWVAVADQLAVEEVEPAVHRSLYATEKDEECRNELRLLPVVPDHNFRACVPSSTPT